MAQAADRSTAWLTARAELEGVLDRLDPEAFVAFASLLGRADGRLFFAGQGRSGLVAAMAAMRFMHLGRRAHLVGEATAPSIRSGDTLVIVSGSGRTPVSVDFARIARREGATVLLVTHQAESPLREIADGSLVVDVASTAQFGGTLFEQSALILLDAVVLGLMDEIDDPVALMWHNHTNLQ